MGRLSLGSAIIVVGKFVARFFARRLSFDEGLKLKIGVKISCLVRRQGLAVSGGNRSMMLLGEVGKRFKLALKVIATVTSFYSCRQQMAYASNAQSPRTPQYASNAQSLSAEPSYAPVCFELRQPVAWMLIWTQEASVAKQCCPTQRLSGSSRMDAYSK